MSPTSFSAQHRVSRFLETIGGSITYQSLDGKNIIGKLPAGSTVEYKQEGETIFLTFYFKEKHHNYVVEIIGTDGFSLIFPQDVAVRNQHPLGLTLKGSVEEMLIKLPFYWMEAEAKEVLTAFFKQMASES